MHSLRSFLGRLAIGGGVFVFVAHPASTALAQDAVPSMEVCIACHVPGQRPAVPMWPSLSGQHAAYIAKQLRDYKAGRRQSPIMEPPITMMTADAIEPLAEYFASQPAPSARAADDVTLAERGRAIYEGGIPAAGVANCAGCHASTALGSPKYPRLAGQETMYVAQQLQDFRSGTRTNDRARVMRVVTAGMSDDDMRAVAEYVATLPTAP